MGTVTHADGGSRTGRDAGATTVAQRAIDFRRCDTAGGGTETDGARRALLTAATADHTMVGKAVVADIGAQLPRRLAFVGTQGTTHTAVETGAAEGALAALEIDLGETAAPGTEQSLRTGIDASAAAIAALDEQPLFQRPGRAHGTPLAAKISAQELRSAHRQIHHAAPRADWRYC